jgi:hypothetical protein
METEVDSNQVTLIQDALKKGLILGAVHIILFVVMYYIFPDMLAGFSYLFLIMAINLGYCIYQGIEWRNGLGGFMGFGTGFKHAFMIMFFNGLLNAVFVFIFMFVEPGLPDAMADAQLESSTYWAARFGAPEDAIDQMKEKFDREEITKRFTPLGQLIGIGFVSIFYAIGALIVALVTRKNEPELM